MSERKPGWYWVKAGNAPWAPSELSMSGHPCIVARGKTYEIGPRIPTPDELDRLYRERDALEAKVEMLCSGIDACIESDWAVPAEEALEAARDETPNKSLARLKAEWQAEAVSDYAFQHLVGHEQELAEIYASKLRLQAEEITDGR